MPSLLNEFSEVIKQVASKSKASTHITEDNVFQEGSDEMLPFHNQIVDTLALPGSGVDGMENLEELYAKAVSGKSCLLLPEHYSNLDLSLITRLVEKSGGNGGKIAKAVVAIAGMKLNEDDPVVSAFASAYSRIIIYPSRSLEGLDPEKDKNEFIRSNTINRAAMKALIRIKTKGRLILVFPSGTRYRPWDPNTKRGVKEIDSYIRSFDFMCPVAINGEVLHVEKGEMIEDSVSKDLVRISAGPVISCKEFRENIISGLDDSCDKAELKQTVADAIMAMLEKMHIEGEEKRQKLLAK